MANTSVLNILVAPLDWGIGHATRCVPIINELLKRGHNVITASDGRSAEFLKKEFPHLKHLSLHSYNIKYTKSGKKLIFKMLIQIPGILRAIFKEHQLLKKIVLQNEVDLVISDNRYGLWHRKVYSVIMTHQLMLKMPKGFAFAEKLIHKIINCVLKKFDECWVPDFEGDINLSGNLSHKYKISSKTFFIGPLSRFSTSDISKNNVQKDIKILFLISGPEPQRSVFEKLIVNHLKSTSFKAIIVRGVTECEDVIKLNENVLMYSHLPTDKLLALINNSEIVVSRSGYSSIMDFYALKVNAILIPTPGQTEQEYLALYLDKMKLFNSISQNAFNVNALLNYSFKTLSVKKIKLEINQNLSERINIITEFI